MTDFLPAERARGITIQSAAISFQWPPQSAKSTSPSEGELNKNLPRSAATHNINLIDTPGHADFTFEVLRSVRVLDGAICVLDGVAGVEAQTEKVWTQAGLYAIPRIIYVNKLDRDGAAFARTVREIGLKLHCWPAICQIPWWKDGGAGGLCGVADVIELRGLKWEGGDGKGIQGLSLDQLDATEPALAAELRKARIALVELLSEHDEEMVEKFLDYEEDQLAIPASDILKSLRKCTLMNPQVVVPVFAGASFRNIGVQPLLDAVNNLLPSPEERVDADVTLGAVRTKLGTLLSGQIALSPVESAKDKSKKGVSKREAKSTALVKNIEACALAFKVVNDARRGVLVYVRVYAGEITRNSLLYNTNLNVVERVPRLFRMYANDTVEIQSIPTGQIGVIVGLKHARTGDTLIIYSGLNPKSAPPAPMNKLRLRPITVPPPLFFTSIEAASLSEEKNIADTLALLLREDPSLYVTQDEESGQTHLAGMGELHLEIARDRLVNDFKVKAEVGKIEIGYREAILSSSAAVTEVFDREVAGKPSRASCTASVAPRDEADIPHDEEDTSTVVHLLDENLLIVNHPTIDTSGEAISSDSTGLPSALPMSDVIQALQTGANAALARGPFHSYPLHSVAISIAFNPSTDIFPTTTPSAISSAARLAIRSALQNAGSTTSSGALMEPVMLVTISVNESDLGPVIHDLSSARGGSVHSLDADAHTESTDSPSIHSSIHQQEDIPFIDVRKIYAPPDPFEGSGSGAETVARTYDKQRQIIARVPLKEMVGYLKHLRSLTGGRGTFVMSLDGFEKMSAQRQKLVLQETRGGY